MREKLAGFLLVALAGVRDTKIDQASRGCPASRGSAPSILLTAAAVRPEVNLSLSVGHTLVRRSADW